MRLTLRGQSSGEADPVGHVKIPIRSADRLRTSARPRVAGSSIGRSRCAPSAATWLTSVLTGHIRSDSSGAGASIGSSSASEADGSSQASSRSGGRMTGMRLWIGATSSFGRVVRMAAVTPSVAAAAPDAGQRQHLAVDRRTDRVRLTRPRRSVPLVEGVGRDHAARRAQGRPEGGRGGGGLGAGVDPRARRAGGRLLGPERLEAPAGGGQAALAVAVDDHPDRLGRRDVVEAVGQVVVGVRAEVVAHVPRRLALAEPAAHRRQTQPSQRTISAATSPIGRSLATAMSSSPAPTSSATCCRARSRSSRRPLVGSGASRRSISSIGTRQAHDAQRHAERLAQAVALVGAAQQAGEDEARQPGGAVVADHRRQVREHEPIARPRRASRARSPTISQSRSIAAYGTSRSSSSSAISAATLDLPVPYAPVISTASGSASVIGRSMPRPSQPARAMHEEIA